MTHEWEQKRAQLSPGAQGVGEGTKETQRTAGLNLGWASESEAGLKCRFLGPAPYVMADSAGMGPRNLHS